MEKPLLVKREELINTLTQTINNSDLHPCIIEPILESLVTEIHSIIQKEYKEEKEQYEQYLAGEQTAEK